MGVRHVARRIGMGVGDGLDWLDKRPGLAGWASAFAAVVAMGLTLWLAWNSSNQTEAQAIAAAVLTQ